MISGYCVTSRKETAAVVVYSIAAVTGQRSVMIAIIFVVSWRNSEEVVDGVEAWLLANRKC